MYKLRYVVPFSWKGSYQDMFGSLSQTAFLTCRKNAYAGSKSRSDNQEQDVYDHILRNFSDDSGDHNAIGSVWEINPEKLPDKPYRLAWYPDAAIEKYFELSITGMGLYLFRNRIGFLWYELKAAKAEERKAKWTGLLNTVSICQTDTREAIFTEKMTCHL